MAADTAFLKVKANLLTQLDVFPQEKIHLHTDRNLYVPGERIRFKAYVTDALTHTFPTRSRYVYAELIDARDSLVSRVMIRPAEENLFHGDLFLSEIIPEGNYTLRAYTRYMENLGDDYFFKKNIRIGNLPSDTKQPSQTPQISRNERAEEDDFDISFFPEGGNLLEGVFCKVAFKALNRNGYPETVSGEIIDEYGTALTSVQSFHAGTGVFSFLPEPGKRYFLKCQNGNGLVKQFELPQPSPRARTLTVSQRNNTLTVGVLKAADSPDIPCYLLAHCRGMVFHFSALNEDDEWIAFPEEALPAGIIQLVLFDQQMNPLSERLVFNNNYIPPQVEFRTDKESYQTHDRVVSTISLTGSAGNALKGHLSVAVTDDGDVAVDSATTILSSLLLSSELKGYIENPAWYLQDNAESAIALDYLMMTHGWRRYNVAEAVRGNPAYPQTPFQTSQEIRGQVRSLARSRPEAGSEVLIMPKDGITDRDFGLTLTDENGAFRFTDFEYPDSTSYFIQALSKKGSKHVELVLNRESFPKPVHVPQSPPGEAAVSQETTKGDDETNAFIEKAEQRSRYDSDMRVVRLSEVVITASKPVKEEPRLRYWANSLSDTTLRRKDFERWRPALVSDIIRGKIAGVNVSSGGGISIRAGNPPLVLIDGFPMDWPELMESPYDSPLEAVSVIDVESIDVFKGVAASAFGVRGANGVISITTRRGIDDILETNGIRRSKELNYAVYTPLGYQKPVAFYSPKYETAEARYLSAPDYRTTIFWKPDLIISEESDNATFEFYTSDFPTTYSVVIEGLTTDGRMVRQTGKIRVE
ncbi:MAG: TonB-dependent receptor plug domain-containing protein [Tannerellaceae bacterium]|nr:TonB-dependent receptor plug domain-containing protein [Tannerellaceae bacterium]